MDRQFFAAGAVSALLAVGLGAFGAHALRDRIGPDLLEVFEVGVRYQFFHALGLFYAGFAWTRTPTPAVAMGGLAVAVAAISIVRSLGAG